jgi:hypothetical protein
MNHLARAVVSASAFLEFAEFLYNVGLIAGEDGGADHLNG